MFRILAFLVGCSVIVAGQPDSGFAQQKKKPVLIPEWGELVAPGKDCKFKALENGLTLTLPASVHDLSIEIGRMNAPRVLQSVKGDFVMQVKVAGVQHPGARSAIPTRKPFCSAGLVVWQNQGNYLRLERAALLNGAENSIYANWELRQNGRFTRAGNPGEQPLTGPETWLRITRTGVAFDAAVSGNGQDWSKLPPMNLPGTNDELQVGILAVNDTPAPFTPEFSEFSLKGPSTE